MNEEREKTREKLKIWAKILFGAAGFCLLMSFVSFGVGREVYKGTLSSNDTVRISLTKVGKIHKIEARPIGTPSPTGYDVELTLLDANENYLFSFGDSFWHEEGWDSEGRWSEGRTKSSLRFILKEAGEHYLRASTPRSIKVKVVEGVMLARYFIILTVLFAVVGFIVYGKSEGWFQ
jgi:hypothetical protein